MARKLNAPKDGPAPAPKDHNHAGLTDDDEAALHAYFRLKINAAEKEAATAKAAYDEKRGAVTDLFASVKAELRVSRKDFEAMLAAASMSDSEFRAAEVKRIRLFTLNGLPVGQQLSLPLGGAQDSATDQADAYSHGLRAGEGGLEPTPPDFISPVMHPEWMRGWHDGQARIGQRMARAQEIIAARSAPKAPEPPPEPEPEFDAAKAARKLKNDPAFMDRSAPPERIEPQPAEGSTETLAQPEAAAA